MRIQEFFCDKNDGTYLISLSKKESERTDLRVECTYKAIGNKEYEIKLFIGVQAYELMSEYSGKTIACNYNRLKENIKIYILTEINKDTADKINDFINEKVIPKPEYSYESIGRVYEICSPLGKKYRATLLAGVVEIKEIDGEKTTFIDGEYTMSEVMDIIKKKEETGSEKRTSILS